MVTVHEPRILPCLGRFAAPRRGPVLLYAAEDAVHIVRARLEGICTSAHVPLDSLDVHVIVDPVVRLDVDADRVRLREAVTRLRPRLVAASSSGIELALGERGGGLTLHVREDVSLATPDSPRSPADRILEALGGATEPLTRRELRDACRLRNATLVDTLAALQTDGRVRVDAGRVQLVLV